MTAEVFAPAKINLTLHVTGQRADGYHLLDSLVVFADVGDRLWIIPAERMRLDVTGAFAEGVPVDGRNLIWQAAELAGQVAHFRVEKNLPHGGGIGGGSSDAAAVLRHYGVSEGAGKLGADVPVCLAARAQRMRGIGEVLEPVSLPVLHAVLVNPGVHVATPDVFKALAVKDNSGMPEPLPAFPDASVLIRWLQGQRNDLEAPARALAPEIGTCLDALAAFEDAALVRMSGSGSSCFALFEAAEGAERAAARLATEHPRWWVRATTLR